MTSMSATGVPLTLVPMISFLSPAWLWLLVVAAALLILYTTLVRRQTQRNVTGPTSLRTLWPRQRTWLRHVAVILAIMSLISLTVAMARPKQQVSVPRELATVVVVLDVSNSMAATDIKPNRLDAAKAAAIEFINSLPPKFNVALVSFASTADVEVNPTVDRGLLTAAINRLQLRPSTAIGAGIYAALQVLTTLPDDSKTHGGKVPAVIVLMSDGSTTVPPPSAVAAEAAKKQGIPIYCIAYGTSEGYIVTDGQRQAVPADPAELARVSRITGGKAYAAKSASQLKEVYKTISTSVGTEKVDQETTARYAVFALVLAILAALGVASLAARWP